LIPTEKDKDKKQALIQEGRDLRTQGGQQEEKVKAVETELRAAVMTLPNMTHPDAPVGTLAEDNKVIKTIGEKPAFDFKVKDHVELCDSLKLADFEAGASVAGQKFYFLKNEAALLELALVQYAFGL